MVLGVVELRKIVRRMRGRASRAAAFLRQISKTSIKRPDFTTIERAGRILQQALGQIKEIATDIDHLTG